MASRLNDNPHGVGSRAVFVAPRGVTKGDEMGLFDYISCKYKLPRDVPESEQFQTKSFDSPYMENYEIREDGSLWREEYEIEDRGDKTAPKGSINRIIGMMTRVNKRWVKSDFTGAVEFYTDISNDWIEFCAVFKNGQIQHIMDASVKGGNK